MKNSVTFSSDDLPQGCNMLGLVQAIESFLQSGKSVFYNFIHLSIQEILSAHYLATWLSDSEQISQFQLLFNKPRFTAVFQFYATITKLKSPGIRQVVDRTAKKKFKPLLVSLLRCLHEAQDPSLCLFLAEVLKYKLDLSDILLSPLDCLSISFFLSSSASKVISVDLNQCCIGDLGLKCMSVYLDSDVDHVGKVTIDLGDNEIQEASSSHIASILSFFEHLYLSSNPIGDAGASLIFKTLKENTTLNTLMVDDCGITSKGAVDLSRALFKNSYLKKLDIGNNNLEDKGISHVAEALKQNIQLEELWIDECGMTDEGAASLANALSANNSLKMLHIGEHKGTLTKDGLSIIIQSLTIKSEFVKVTVACEFDSTDYIRQEVNEARKRNELPPISTEGEYCS